jgi:hypothetical protein
LQRMHKQRVDDIGYGECSRMPDVTPHSLLEGEAGAGVPVRRHHLFSILALGDPVPGHVASGEADQWVADGSDTAASGTGASQSGFATLLSSWWQGVGAGRRLMPQTTGPAGRPGTQLPVAGGEADTSQ